MTDSRIEAARQKRLAEQPWYKRLDRWISRKEKTAKATVVALVSLIIVAFLALIFGLYCCSALLGEVAWNDGVKNIVKTSGGTIGSIGFWTSFGGVLALSFLGSIFKRPFNTTTKD